MANTPVSRSQKIRSDLLRKVKIIVDARDGEISIQEYLESCIEPVVARDYPKALKRLNDDAAKEGGK